MNLPTAMAVIARFQEALLAGGANIGTYGPRADGVDGRYGPATRAGMDQLAQGGEVAPYGEDGKPTVEFCTAMGFNADDCTVLDQAIATWWSWRQQHKSDPDYQEQANAALCEGYPEICAVAEDQMVPAPANGAMQTAGGIMSWPWWAWLLILLGVGAVAGTGYLVYRKYFRKKRRRKLKTAPAFGTQVTEEEFAYEPPEDEEET